MDLESKNICRCVRGYNVRFRYGTDLGDGEPQAAGGRPSRGGEFRFEADQVWMGTSGDGKMTLFAARIHLVAWTAADPENTISSYETLGRLYPVCHACVITRQKNR